MLEVQASSMITAAALQQPWILLRLKVANEAVAAIIIQKPYNSVSPLLRCPLNATTPCCP